MLSRQERKKASQTTGQERCARHVGVWGSIFLEPSKNTQDIRRGQDVGLMQAWDEPAPWEEPQAWEEAEPEPQVATVHMVEQFISDNAARRSIAGSISKGRAKLSSLMQTSLTGPNNREELFLPQTPGRGLKTTLPPRL